MITTSLTHDGQTARIFLPDNYAAQVALGKKYGLVLALHGLGNTALSYEAGATINNSTYVDIALANGFIFAVCSSPVNTFGDSDVVLDRQKAFYDYVQANYAVYKKAVFWTHSAGGGMGHNLIRKYPTMNLGVVGVFPVYDYAQTIGVGAPSSASTFNPKNFFPQLAGRNYFIVHGDSDATVLLAGNSQALRTDLRDIGGNVNIFTVVGGTHSQNTAYVTGPAKAFFDAALKRFLQNLQAGTVATKVIPRRGSSIDHATFVGEEFELTLNVTTGELRQRDGVTPGGKPVKAQPTTTTSSSSALFIDNETIKDALDENSNTFIYVNKLTDDFLRQSTATGRVGELGWNFTNGSILNNNYESGHPGISLRGSGTTAEQVSSMFLASSATTSLFSLDEFIDYRWVQALAQLDAFFDIKFGVTVDAGSMTPANGIYFEKLRGDTNWFAVCRASGVQTRTDTGLSASTAWINFKIRKITNTSYGFSVYSNGTIQGSEIVISTNTPAITTGVQPFHIITPVTEGANKNAKIDYFSCTLKPVNR